MHHKTDMKCYWLYAPSPCVMVMQGMHVPRFKVTQCTGEVVWVGLLAAAAWIGSVTSKAGCT